MAKRNYVKLTNGDDCLIIGFYKPCGELVDVLDSTNPYLTNMDQEKINRWIYDGISPAEFEDEEAIRRGEIESYGRRYNR